MFEHTITYLPLQYQTSPDEGSLFKRKGLLSSPDVASLTNNPNFDQLFRRMGQDGWELVCAQPLLQGVYERSTNMNQSYGLGFSITVGYYFFWRRAISNLEERK
jgi:hypothetical protein